MPKVTQCAAPGMLDQLDDAETPLGDLLLNDIAGPVDGDGLPDAEALAEGQKTVQYPSHHISSLLNRPSLV